MPPMLSLDGKILDRDHMVISPANRAFRYGDGIFESIRISRGRILWEEFHFERLEKAASVLQLIMDREWTPAYFHNAIMALFSANHKEKDTARVRFALFRRDGGLYTPHTNSASFLVESEPLDDHTYKLNTKGLSISIYEDIRKSHNLLSPLKSINAMMYVLASIYKRNGGFGDVLLLNEDGHIAESTSSNVFIVKNGKLITPALSQSCVEGVMRRVIIQLAADNQIPLTEGIISLKDLMDADEVFLTNAIQGIRWVKAFGRKTYVNAMSVKLTDMLNEAAGFAGNYGS